MWRWIAVATPLAIGIWVVVGWKGGGIPRDRRDAGPETTRETPLANPHQTRGPADSGGNLEGSLLDQMNGKAASEARSGNVETSAQLEQEFNAVISSNGRLAAIKDQVMAARKSGKSDAQAQMAEGRTLIGQMNQQLATLEQNLGAARQARPQDPILQWLTGELLMFVGGEPDEIRPYFQRAVQGGVDRPRAFAGLANVEYEAGQYEAAYQTALKGLEKAPRDQAAWAAYSKAAIGLDRPGEVLARLDKTFSSELPPWASLIRRRAEDLAMQWTAEQVLRRAEDKAGNLPVVRFTIQHRRYAPSEDRSKPPVLENTERGQAEVELFEDQAPATVSNFIHLVSQGFYDGTLFHLAESGLVVGGDPNTKNSDPQDDGSGGPGYTIPDEFQKPGAREAFRGSLCMVATGPNTAGSQFFVTLVPHPEFNRHFTVFGRVLRGQEVLDRITPGRTNLRVGHMGKIIPGDVLVKAEVVRKRPHTYAAVKNPS
jgi:peptidyl-prolyl cis-trans isomerase A (cyclophilin A)